MFKNLYDCFKHWYHGGSIYLYSDPHFSDEEMKELRKDYIGDDEQVKAINKVVHKNDTLIVLGDVGDTSFVAKLKAGYKVLVLGNHDKGASNYKRELIEKTIYKTEVLDYGKINFKNAEAVDLTNVIIKLEKNAKIDNGLFDEVYEGPLMISDKILLSHEPVDFKYAFNIHGHDHSLWSIPDSMHMNVCAEHLNYKPILLKSIIESGKLKNVPNIHRETIDKAIAKQK